MRTHQVINDQPINNHEREEQNHHYNKFNYQGQIISSFKNHILSQISCEMKINRQSIITKYVSFKVYKDDLVLRY